MKYFQLIRISHWVKNGYVFAPIFFGGAMIQSDKILSVTIAFLLFSLMASAVYIFNDWMDLDADQRHPVKKNRPLAAGNISIGLAMFLMSIFFLVSLALSFYINKGLGLVILGYAIINLLYSIQLKKVAILDVSIIALGFLTRVWAGGIVSGVILSHWLVIMIFLLSLFLAFAKRRDDIIQIHEKGESNKIRASHIGYNLDFINIVLAIMSSILLLVYLMYITSPDVVSRLGSQYAYLSFVFVLLGLMRYLQMVFVEKNSGNPTANFWKDAFIQITVICWVLFFTYMLYIV